MREYNEGKAMTKESAVRIIVGILAGIFAVSMLVSGISAKQKIKNESISMEEFWDGNKIVGTYVTGSVHYSTNAYLQINHSIRYIIPAGKEFYYVIFNEEQNKCISVRASEDWNNIFNSDTGYSASGKDISGVIKPMKSEVQAEFAEVKELLRQDGWELEISNHYIDTNTNSLANMKIIVGLLSFLIIVLVALNIRQANYGGNLNGWNLYNIVSVPLGLVVIYMCFYLWGMR